MNFAWSVFGGSAVRMVLNVIGGYLLALGFTQEQVTAISGQITSGHSAGLIVSGIAPIVVSVLWSRYRAKVTTIIDSAVHHSGAAASPLAPAAPVAKAKVVAGKLP